MAKVKVLSHTLAWLMLASIALSGCSDSGTGANNQEKPPETTEHIPSDTDINILTSVFPSPKEQNPYSAENMNKTLRNFILANNAEAKDIPKLEANFLYVRFLPYGKQGVYELKTYDTSLVLLKHPMDYNEIRKPVVYVDKTLPDSIIPYFASVPVGYEFGSTPYEILQELFLTQPLEEDDGDDQEDSRFVKAKKSNKANKEIAAYLKSQGLAPYQLEMIAFPNSERLNAEIESSSGRILAKNIPVDMDNIVSWNLPFVKTWRPDGTLKFMGDSSTKYKEQFLVGVRVTAGYSYYWRSSTTDSYGYFRSPEKWTFSVDYEANFDSDQFLLEDGHSWYGEDLEIEKNNKKSAWNETFTGNDAKWCVIWTAAWNYWYGNNYGLKRPRQNEWWNQSLDIWVYYKNDEDYDEDIGDSYGEYKCRLFTERIAVKAYSRSHIQIYGSTIHEIAHSSHYWNVNAVLGINIATYALLPKILKETYARGIQRYLSIKHYGNWSEAFYDSEYTGIFEDLEDTDSTFARTNKYCDKVSGITAPMAEKAVFNSLYWEHFFWDNFKDNLMEYYPSGTTNENGKKVSYTKADMDNLFDYWKNGTSGSCPVLSSSSAMLSSSSTTPSSSSVIASDGPGPDFKDSRDDYVYKTTKIGSQIWLAENLNYNAPGSRCYDDDPANCEIYGRLYDWSKSMALPDSCNNSSCASQIKNPHQGICPAGWHIPTHTDWDKLISFAVGYVGDGMISKELRAKSSLWMASFGISNSDDFGFSALPSGMYNDVGYVSLHSHCYFWGTTEVPGRYGDDPNIVMSKTNQTSTGGGETSRKTWSLSIRCIKD
jgi:uncharacterized protein (TIGR02145 family)